MGAVGPITTGPSENAVSRSLKKRSVGDSGPEMIAISQVAEFATSRQPGLRT